jgi:hypothetical protein
MDTLVFVDLTTGPDGASVTFEERLGDIRARYPAGDPVYRAMAHAQPHLAASVERTLRRLAACAQPMYGADRPSR